MKNGFRGSPVLNDRRGAGSRRPGLGALCALLVVAALWLGGCAVHVGPTGLDVVLAGTFYGHVDEQADKGGEGEDGDKGASWWGTYAARTWGTSGIEGKITNDSELISIQGEGLSKNLSETLGKDVVKEAFTAALKATPLGAGAAVVNRGIEAVDDDELLIEKLLPDSDPDEE